MLLVEWGNRELWAMRRARAPEVNRKRGTEMERMYQQGDVLLKRRESLPPHTKKLGLPQNLWVETA